jgi:hypothetical protein
MENRLIHRIESLNAFVGAPILAAIIPGNS